MGAARAVALVQGGRGRRREAWDHVILFLDFEPEVAG